MAQDARQDILPERFHLGAGRELDEGGAPLAVDGGVDTAALDSRSMAAKAVPGLYFVGEAVDVTGWLGGYNFQWAWSSGWAAGEAA